MRTFWPALRDTLATGQTFDAIIAHVRPNLRKLHAAAIRASENRSPD
ncbi:MAG TPA: hypothetical protein VKE40_08260 [Gemmataceae bacterium]|nr:hypothetical protein [Gemmataceae bacterium]